jgi:hyperosmotically inducible protein
MKRIDQFSNALLAIALAACPMAASAKTPADPAGETAAKVRRELVMLPFYGIFDNIWFSLNDGIVTLYGSATRPTLASSAERVVQGVPGVASVINRIEVLPLSPFDDRVRLGVARAIYGQAQLSRYGLGANPAIRIVVKNGEVWLEGMVLNEGDRTIANLQANGVFGVFKVNNNLRIEAKTRRSA